MKKNQSTILLIAFLSILSYGASAQLILNEVVSSSETSLIINGESPDWLEIYNSGNETVDITSYYLSDNADDITKWQFPTTTIAPGEFIVILADDQDTVDNYIHTNFKISSSGETLLFSDADAQLIESIDIPALERDVSYGKINGVWNFLVPTPEAANFDAPILELAEPLFNLETGLYNNNITLSINSEIGSRLEYSLNDLGQNLEVDTSFLELNLDSSTIICVRAVQENAISSSYVCHTYLIDAEHNLPVLSIIADEHSLFDEVDGLFEMGPDADPFWPYYGANFWSDRDEEIYFQYFNKEDEETFFAQCDLEMHGGRESRTNPQKTFRLLAKAKYNQEFFEHSFFPSKPDADFNKRLVVRNASGDFNAGNLRDGFLQDYLESNNLDLYANAYQPVAVYINGQYYGMMAIRERMDRFYHLVNHGTTNVDLIENQNELKEGSFEKFDEDNNFLLESDLSNDLTFNQAAERFDINNLTDYFLSQICNNSTAWPQNNIRYWRIKSDTSKWRYLLYDMDIALGRWPWTEARENSLQSKMTSFQDTNVLINTIQAFLENDNFKNYFLNRHQDLYNTDFSGDSIIVALDAFTDTISSEMMLHLERWPTIDFEQWEGEELDKIKTFVRDRPDYSIQFYMDFFEVTGTFNLTVTSENHDFGDIYLNSLDALRSDFQGIYYDNIPITVTSVPIEGKFFRHWEIVENGETSFSSFSTLTRRFTNDASVRAIYKDELSDIFIESIHFNMTSNQFNIKINTLSDENLDFIVYDSSGRVLQSGQETSIISGENFINLPVRLNSSGIFFLRLRQGDNTHTQKFFSLN